MRMTGILCLISKQFADFDISDTQAKFHKFEYDMRFSRMLYIAAVPWDLFSYMYNAVGLGGIGQYMNILITAS